MHVNLFDGSVADCLLDYFRSGFGSVTRSGYVSGLRSVTRSGYGSGFGSVTRSGYGSGFGSVTISGYLGALLRSIAAESGAE